MTLNEAKDQAKRVSSDEICVQHVVHSMWDGECNGYYVSDWYENGTVISYENGVEL